MRQTKQQRIKQLENDIKNMYSSYEVTRLTREKDDEIKDLQSRLKHSEMCTQATQIQLATYKGMVDVYERITDTKEKQDVDL